MRITSKGQVTIPQAIREKTGLLPHTEVEFHYTRGRVVLKPITKPKPEKKRYRRSAQRFGGRADRPMNRCLEAGPPIESWRFCAATIEA